MKKEKKKIKRLQFRFVLFKENTGQFRQFVFVVFLLSRQNCKIHDDKIAT